MSVEPHSFAAMTETGVTKQVVESWGIRKMIRTVFDRLLKETWFSFRFRSNFKCEAWTHAKQLFNELFPNGYPGEVFLCGGAFKPLLKKGFAIADLDLFVRTPEEREKLCAALVAQGAVLVRDFPPNCIKFRLSEKVVEVAYHDMKSGSLDDLLSIFDLALCGIGSRYANGRVTEVHVRRDFWNAVKHRSVNAQNSYINLLIRRRHPTLLSSLYRMGRQAAELSYQVSPNDEHRLWEIYWNEFTETERHAAMEYYIKTTVQYKGVDDKEFLRRAGKRLLWGGYGCLVS